MPSCRRHTVRVGATQAVLIGPATAFTAVMVLLVAVLDNPFAAGPGRVPPDLLQQTGQAMAAARRRRAAEPWDLDRPLRCQSMLNQPRTCATWST